MFASRALAIVMFSDDEPFLAVVAPALGEVGDGRCSPVNIVCDVDFAGRRIDSSDKRVFGDVGEMALVFEPGACGRNGVCCALALDFVQDAE